MGNCLSAKPPEIPKIKSRIDRNRCFQFKDDNCPSSCPSSCCIFNKTVIVKDVKRKTHEICNTRIENILLQRNRTI